MFAIGRLVSEDAELTEAIREECIRCLESMLTLATGRVALARLHSETDSAMLTLLLSAASPRLSTNYALLVLRPVTGSSRWQGVAAASCALFAPRSTG